MENYLIVADDFTGSNDTGVQLRRRGIPVNVVFSDELIKGEDSCVLDTESRALKPKEAFEKVSKNIASIPFNSFSHVMKKVDSTLRGSIGAEIKAIDNYYQSELIVFAPALPDLGRVTLNKIHQLNGVPITKTEIAWDPNAPVTDDNIYNIMKNTFDEPVVHIGIDDVHSGNIDLNGARLFTFDTAVNSDMQNIIKAALKTKKRILWVGAAAMADNLLSINYAMPPSLAVIASLSSVTRGQVVYAEKQGVKLVQVPMHEVLENKLNLQNLADTVAGLLKSGEETILLSSATYSDDELQKSFLIASQKGISKEDMSIYTAKSIAQITALILEKVKISGLFLSGGDTAMGFFDTAKSLGSSIITEIAIGIPMMYLRGGKYDGLKIVTKAGAFGKEDAVFYALRKLKEIDCAS
jgi:uncharacterized protein YgbK (DUF1537 family)